MLAISQAHNEARLQATATRLNGGSLSIFGTTRPAFGATPGGDPLVTIPLADPCGTVGGNALTLTPSAEVQVQVSGTAVWGRFYNALGEAEIDADVGVEITLPTAVLYAGGFSRLASAVFG